MSPNICRLSAILILVLMTAVCVSAQVPDPTPKPSGNGISLAPARLELEMQPGAETTVVINLDYHSTSENSQPVRIVASLNDWTIDRNGQVRFEKPNTLPNSASSWLIYSPAETTVIPGNLHAIRVTVSVPKDATPGDHLTSLVIEQRPDNIKVDTNRRQMVIKYRMAAAFYIKVPQLRRQGSLESLKVDAKADELTVTPLLKNVGNSVIRPLTSLKKRALEIENSLLERVEGNLARNVVVWILRDIQIHSICGRQKFDDDDRHFPEGTRDWRREVWVNRNSHFG